MEPNQGIKIDWSRPYSEIEQNPILQQMKPYDIMRDYQKNGDGNWSAFMPWLSSLGDADKTVAANAALQKKAENQAKWEQWGNLLCTWVTSLVQFKVLHRKNRICTGTY